MIVRCHGRMCQSQPGGTVSYFAAAVVRDADGWSASRCRSTDAADVEDVADRLRDVDPDADVSLLFVESDDTYLVILRLDQGEDLRVFGSDSAFAEESRLGALLLGDVDVEPAPELEASRARPRLDRATSDRDELDESDLDDPTGRPADADPAGDADLLADLGVPAALLELCAPRGHAARRRHRRGVPGHRLRRRGRGAARGMSDARASDRPGPVTRRWMRRALGRGRRARARRCPRPAACRTCRWARSSTARTATSSPPGATSGS